MFETTVEDGVLCARRDGARWLSSGWSGGFHDANVAYNVSVPEGFERTDLDAYLDERRTAAGFEESGPSLLTGVQLQHAFGARSGPVEAIVTAGVSNPAALPQNPYGRERVEQSDSDEERPRPGTVNVLLGTTRALDDGSLATLLSVAVEAKATTLLAETAFPGTTTDAVVVACDPEGEPATFAGSGTPIGAAARACVRGAVRESLRSRYENREMPRTVEAAKYGVSTDRRAETFELDGDT